MPKKITDKQRIDFLEKHDIEIGLDDMGYGEYAYYAHGPFPKLREVIDRMMAERMKTCR